MADLSISIPHPVTPELAELIAQRMRVIGDPVRIRLLDHLRDGEASVTAERLKASPGPASGGHRRPA